MPDLQTDRAYRVLLRRLGSKLRTGLAWKDTIQPVAVVDQLSHLQEPNDNRWYWVGLYRAGTPGSYSVATILAGSTGFWLHEVWNSHLNNVGVEVNNPATGSMTVPAAPPARFGDVVTSLSSECHMGTRVGAPNTFAGRPILYSPVVINKRLFVPPAWALEFISVGVDNEIRISCLIEELTLE